MLSCDSKYVVDMIMWPKSVNSTISMRKVIVTLINNLTRETYFAVSSSSISRIGTKLGLKPLCAHMRKGLKLSERLEAKYGNKPKQIVEVIQQRLDFFCFEFFHIYLKSNWAHFSSENILIFTNHRLLVNQQNDMHVWFINALAFKKIYQMYIFYKFH